MIKQTNKITGKLNASVIHVYPELENIEITPAVEDQTYTPTKYGFEEVKVKGVQAYIDEDIKPEYIKDGVDILGVIGNVVELQGEEKTIVPSISQQVILPSEDKNGMTKITVKAVDNTIDEDIKPENIVDGVEILGIVGNYKGIDTSDATVSPSDVLAGKTVYINNQKIVGTLPNNGELEFDPSDEEQQVPKGYTSGGLIKSADITKLNEYDVCLNLVNSIDNLGDYTDTTATAEDILEGKTAYSNGERIVGTMEVSDDNAKISTSIESGTPTLSGILNIIKKVPENLTLSGTTATYLFANCTSLEEIPESLNTSNATSINGLAYNCTQLTKVPKLNFKSVSGINFQNVFYGCTNLTEESLNNILYSFTYTGSISGSTSYKSLKYIGLTEEQATICRTLSNWDDLVGNNWVTGY